MSTSNEWIYTVEVQDDGEDFFAYTPDLPEVLSRGLWGAIAIAGIRSSLAEAVRRRIANGMELPVPVYRSDNEDSQRIALPKKLAKQATFYHAWKASGKTEEAYRQEIGLKKT